ncbi:MAG: transporter, family [Bacteroidota bacterium]|nr:transporter, family [Bacteroidota bacterium]
MKSDRKERISWYLYDWANSAFSTSVVTVFLGPYLTTIAKNAAGADGYLDILGIPIYSGSYFAYIVSLSVLAQVIFLPLSGAIADYSRRKKQILGITAFLGSAATMGMYFLEGSRYLLGGGLFIFANTCFGISVVMYNSFLNDIAEPDKRDSVSSIGWAIGYIGGGALLAANLALYSMSDSLGIAAGDAVRISLSSAGLWWALFTIFPMLFLRERKPARHLQSRKSLLTVGFRQLAATVKDARNYPQALMFLAENLLYNDGVQSVIALSSQFGQEELGLSISTLTQVILMVQFVAFFGSLLFKYLAERFDTKKTIQMNLAVWCIVLLYVFYFLNSEAGFFVIAAVIAIIMGGVQALSRSMFSRLIPQDKEAEYFGLYEVSEKGTSWLGPLLFGISLQFTGSYRFAILSLIVFFVLGLILLLKVRANGSSTIK